MEQGTFDFPDEPAAPVKLCECGCGQPAPIPKKNIKRLGHVKGQPIRFLPGHNVKLKAARLASQRQVAAGPAALCECGCGKPVPLASATRAASGWVKGQPIRFLRGHSGGTGKKRLSVELGQRFGLGVVIDPEVRLPQSGKGLGVRGARLLCDCGTEYVCDLGALLDGRSKSCGCIKYMTQDERVAAGLKPNGRPVLDRTGQRFGKLTVLSFVDTEPGHARWLCRCDCGRDDVIVAVGNLLKGIGCGCGQTGPRVDRAPGATARLRVLQQYQRGAKSRGLDWSLTDEDFDALTSLPCHYCGQPPATVYRAGKYEGGTFTYNGLDRRDPQQGYVDGNVLPCCPFCNRAKSDMSYEDFMVWTLRLVMNQWDHPERMPHHLPEGGD